MTGSEGANDALVINGLGGNDGITATTLAAGVVKLTIDGGAGNDTILGSQGADMLLGGDGNDFIFGDNGNDLALMGAGDDMFQWNPGDGNDTIEGQDGTDTMLFFGANVAENIDISANGGRVRFFRDVANVTMDLNDVEQIDFRALGGADNIVVGDLSGTDVKQVDARPARPERRRRRRGRHGRRSTRRRATTCSASPATPAGCRSSACGDDEHLLPRSDRPAGAQRPRPATT